MQAINFQRLMLASILANLALMQAVHAKDKAEKDEDIWQQDLSDAFNIDASSQGIQKVNLKCGSNSMVVQLETEKDFTGVMYTRGSFYKQAEPCFVKPTQGRARSLEMRFPFDQCQTIQDGDSFSNVVVVQNDPELVTPGDAAFSLECDFRKSRSLSVGADYQARDRIASGSRITLTSPDPSTADHVDKDGQDSVHSDSDTVTYIPHGEGGTEQKVIGTVETLNINSEKHDEL